ncbi:putative organic anion transporter [Fasciola gigantica]|uniref:Putative organic anion transporter n=1 Tax=Fasciola gigantica TaxID=46835 RepID=A0A504YPB9_FASGI|nr:putative organic anion transporter [Fasciola gigantica]
MPNPRVSRNTSHHSPVLSPAGVTDPNPSAAPVDWNANVVNFISNCRHPGLVRRTSLAAQFVPVLNSAVAPTHSFRPRHRRNLSAATTVGRYADTPKSSVKLPYASFLPYYQSNNFNTNQRSGPDYISRTVFGHSRNISDPTACWECFHVDPRTFHVPDYHIFPLPQHLSRQLSSTSPERIDEVSVTGDTPDQASSYHSPPAWRKSSVWNGLDESDGIFDGHLGEKFPVMEKEAEAEVSQIPVKPDSVSEGRCLLPCLQSCANPVSVLLGLFFIMFVQTMVVSGLISSMLTTLERRFNFSTRQVGYMISCYEGSGVLTTVAISFVNGQKHNRLRVVGLSTLLLAMGFGIFALPHFLVGPYNPDLSVASGISAISNSATQSNLSASSSANFSTTNAFSGSQRAMNSTVQNEPIHSLVLCVFCVAMVLAGIGASPLHVLAPTYLWDNLSDKQYPLYSALFYSAGGLGPACGFLAGAGFLSVYIDSPLILPRIGLNRNDPLWLGAWWLGMLVCASVTLVAALPVIAFPKRLINQSDAFPPQSSQNGNKNNSTPTEPWNPKIGIVENHLGLLDTPRSNQSVHIGAEAQLHGNFHESARSEFHARPPLTHRRTQSNQISIYKPLSDGTNQLVDASVTVIATETRQTQPRATSESALSAGCRTRAIVRQLSTPLSNGASLTRSFQQNIPDPEELGFERTPLNTLGAQLRERFKGFLLVLRRVMANPIWFGVTFTSMLEQSIVAAFLAFAAKYIQDLFQVPAYMASIHTGAVVVPSSLIGVLSGALIMRHYRPRIDRTLVGISMLIGGTVLTTISLMLISCPGNRVAGLTATYSGEPWPWLYGPARIVDPNLTAVCNTRRPKHLSAAVFSLRVGDPTLDQDLTPPCSPTQFIPVCWRSDSTSNDDVNPRYLTFFSPCHAGCQSRRLNNRPHYATAEEFTDCTCVTQSSLNPSGEPVYDSSGKQIAFGHVTAGRCPTDCPQYAAFLAILFLHILLTGMLQNPSNVITLSCVSPEDSSVALGLQIFFMRTLAYIPAPIYFGQLFDLVCQYRLVTNGDPSQQSPVYGARQHNHNSPNKTVVTAAASHPVLSSNTLPIAEVPTSAIQTGACLQYNLEGLPVVWLGMILSLKLVSLIGAASTWYASRRLAQRQGQTGANCSTTGSRSPPFKTRCSTHLPASFLDATHSAIIDGTPDNPNTQPVYPHDLAV